MHRIVSLLLLITLLAACSGAPDQPGIAPPDGTPQLRSYAAARAVERIAVQPQQHQPLPMACLLTD